MAARTFGQLKQAVQDEGYGNDTAAPQGNFLNSEYRRLAGRRRWKWLEAQNSTLTTTPGVAIYPIPMSDVRSLDAVRLSDNVNNTYYVEPMVEQTLRDLYHRDLGITSTPGAWTQYANQLWLWPTPAAVYTVTFDYIKNVVPMADDGDTPLVPETYDDILVWGAIARMAVRSRDWLTRSFALQERDALEQAMISDIQMLQRQRSDTVEDTLWGPQ